MAKFPGNFNMNNMMKQFQKMQQEMEKVQKELDEMKIEATSGGGAVKVVSNGKKQIMEINISPEVVDPEDVEMLQDLVLAAVNEALQRSEDAMKEKMSRVTGGIDISGLL
ncbi:MAG: YbaB/EbfC family nucleoid-associated protein [Thermoanaerobacteraceae bacterium]|nr:YbaB/EbfC family nucleoid-associated protein [Thermoanaerobacteraceae bacterium]